MTNFDQTWPVSVVRLLKKFHNNFRFFNFSFSKHFLPFFRNNQIFRNKQNASEKISHQMKCSENFIGIFFFFEIFDYFYKKFENFEKKIFFFKFGTLVTP